MTDRFEPVDVQGEAAEMEEHEEGDYVKYSDYCELEEKYNRLSEKISDAYWSVDEIVYD